LVFGLIFLSFPRLSTAELVKRESSVPLFCFG
jgi:hypothetical protein